jgi:hypothetical protein
MQDKCVIEAPPDVEQIKWKERRLILLNNWHKVKLNGSSNDSLEIKFVPNKGMGVFAKKDFKQNDVVEYCYSIVYDWRSKYQRDSTTTRYSYGIACNCKTCKEHGTLKIQPLGYGSIYNSADKVEDRNAQYYIYLKERLIAFEAVKDINKGEEILTWFGQPYYDFWITNLGDKNNANKLIDSI